MKTQTIELFGRKLKIEVPYDEPRKKFTTQISETNYKFIKELSIKSHKEISVLCDVMINTIKDNNEILGEYFKKFRELLIIVKYINHLLNSILINIIF